MLGLSTPVWGETTPEVTRGQIVPHASSVVPSRLMNGTARTEGGIFFWGTAGLHTSRGCLTRHHSRGYPLSTHEYAPDCWVREDVNLDDTPRVLCLWEEASVSCISVYICLYIRDRTPASSIESHAHPRWEADRSRLPRKLAKFTWWCALVRQASLHYKPT